MSKPQTVDPQRAFRQFERMILLGSSGNQKTEPETEDTWELIETVYYEGKTAHDPNQKE